MFRYEWRRIRAESVRARDKRSRLPVQTGETTRGKSPFYGFAAPGPGSLGDAQLGTSLPKPAGRGCPDLLPAAHVEKWNRCAACQSQTAAAGSQNARVFRIHGATPA